MTHQEWMIFAVERGMSSAVAGRMWRDFGVELLPLTVEEADEAMRAAVFFLRRAKEVES